MMIDNTVFSEISMDLTKRLLKQNKKKTIMIFGGAGFIGHHLARRLKNEGNFVICVDIKSHEEAAEYDEEISYCNIYKSCDLSVYNNVFDIIYFWKPDEIYQLAADMGGAGYIFTGNNDFDIMTNSVSINLNLVKCLKEFKKAKYFFKHKIKVFYSSSACMYPAFNQENPDSPDCKESSAYPAEPDSEYGWEKLFSERLYLTAHKEDILDARIARYHNIFGPEGTWEGGKEKAPAAICRKVAETSDEDNIGPSNCGNSFIEIWGPGNQTRSFLYIDECVEATIQLMNSEFTGPVNIGSEEMISINDLARMVIGISDKNLEIVNIPGPVGVMGRNSNNDLIREKLGWDYKQSLEDGIKKLYPWIKQQVDKRITQS